MKPSKETEASIAKIQFILGLSEIEPIGTRFFLELRSDIPTLKESLKKFVPLKSKAKKSDWINAFCDLSQVDRQQVLTECPAIFWILPRDAKTLRVKSLNAIGTKSFNPGKRIEFSIFSLKETLDMLEEKYLINLKVSKNATN